LELGNPGPEAVERWITVGHPRLAEVSLFTPRPLGWVRHDVGNRTPMAARGEIERDFGVLPVKLNPYSHQVVWLRVLTDTAADLSTTLWQPIDYLRITQMMQFWAALALGGILTSILFSLLMYARTRQSAYGLFAIWLNTPFFMGILTSGLLQRFVWPADRPLPSEAIAVSLLIGMLAYYGFIHAFLPQSPKYPKTALLFKGSVAFTCMALIFGIFIDYGAVAKIWSFSILVTLTSASLVTYLAWRDGDRSAGILLLAFGMNAALGVLRLLFSVGVLTWDPKVALIAPWAQALSAPLILLSLMDRTRQLQAELAQVQAESTARLDFLAKMSHELHSPMDTILGNAQLQLRKSQNCEYTAGLGIIFDSGRHLLRMIDHILDYARGMSGVIRVAEEPVNMEAFMRGIERTGRLLASRQRNNFVLRQSAKGQGRDGQALLMDAGHLRQILGNLLANAARHTRDGSIALDYSLAALGQGRLRLDFAVTDTGEGIALKDQQRIFRPFERARHEGNYDGKGAGLGLTIARQLTELMGGSLSVHSAPGQGACFRFWIIAKPLATDAIASAEQSEEFDAIGYTGRRRTLLVVDDEAINREILTELLGELGFLVVQADSGRNAVKSLKALTELDLVITDQFMPNGDGWMVLEAISSERPDVPVLLVSAAPPSPPPNWPVHCRFAAHFLRSALTKLEPKNAQGELYLTDVVAIAAAAMTPAVPVAARAEVLVGCNDRAQLFDA
ncbi:MAG: ATP-binding protein, partial [Candidatus Methylumidiphilus sp.]